MAAPAGKTMRPIRAGGVGLAGELGHAVFVMKMVERELEKFGELRVEIWLGKRNRSAFVASGFEEVGTRGKRN